MDSAPSQPPPQSASPSPQCRRSRWGPAAIVLIVVAAAVGLGLGLRPSTPSADAPPSTADPAAVGPPTDAPPRPTRRPTLPPPAPGPASVPRPPPAADPAAVGCTIINPSSLEWTKILADDGAAEDRFGWSVAVDDDTMVVGAPWDDDKGDRSGSAYVFVRSGDKWVQQDKLAPDDGAAGDRFGWSVAIDRDTIVVGANGDDDKGSASGSAYVYVRSGEMWARQEKLVADDGAASDWFGTSVAVDDDTIVVGARYDNDKGSWSGSAYIFVRSGEKWVQQDKLVPDDGDAGDYLGESIAVDDDTIVVGAWGDDDKGSSSGAAYVFVRSGDKWVREDKLVPDDGAALDYFGESVAIDRDTIVVGAYRDDDKGSASGAAYVFVRSGGKWAQQAKLVPDDGTAEDNFGLRVAISGGTIVVGAPDDNDNGDESGSAYLFTRTGNSWLQKAKLVPDDGMADDDFGFSAAVSGGTAVVGARYNDDSGSNSGSAYAVELC